jgi:hypothetical protein
MSEQFLRMRDVAARFHKSKRWLKGYLRQHPFDRDGKPFYRLAGRSKLFTEADVLRLFESFPAPAEPAWMIRQQRGQPAAPDRSSRNSYAEAVAKIDEWKKNKRKAK